MILRKPLARCKSMLPTIIGLVLGLGTDLKNNQPVIRKKDVCQNFGFDRFTEKFIKTNLIETVICKYMKLVIGCM